MAKKATTRKAVTAGNARLEIPPAPKREEYSRVDKIKDLRERAKLLVAEAEKLEKERVDSGKRTLRVIGTGEELLHSFHGLTQDECDLLRRGLYRVLVQKLDYEVTLSVETEYE